MKNVTAQTAIPAQADALVQTADVDQSGTIRTLTEAEMAIVSGGYNYWNTPFQQKLRLMAEHFQNSSLRDYISSNPRINALTFRTLNFWYY
jgi:hypothetical protein